jgi:hypothetical protein
VWNTPIPGLGLSSPIVWGDLIFISTSISGKTDSSLKVGYYGDALPADRGPDHGDRPEIVNRAGQDSVTGL